jgi:hypothetical protein
MWYDKNVYFTGMGLNQEILIVEEFAYDFPNSYKVTVTFVNERVGSEHRH